MLLELIGAIFLPLVGASLFILFNYLLISGLLSGVSIFVMFSAVLLFSELWLFLLYFLLTRSDNGKI